MAKNTITNEQLDEKLTKIESLLKNMFSKNELDKEYLSTAETCRFLACQRTMIWKLVQSGKLTKLKLENGRTYYASAELKKLIETPIKHAA